MLFHDCPGVVRLLRFVCYLALVAGSAALSPASGQTACTYVVAQDGTGQYTTINEAAQVATAGNVVCVKEGRYYETVRPARGGTASAPVTYRAFPGHERRVVVSGAAPIPAAQWVQDGQDWKWTWAPGSNWDLENGWFSYALDRVHGPPLVQRRELLIAQSGAPVTGTAPASLFDGHVMRAVATRGELSSTYAQPERGVYGTYWVDAAPGQAPVAIYARFYGGRNPTLARPMIAARRRTFLPRRPAPNFNDVCGTTGTPGYLHVSGIVFRHTNNREQEGSVCPGDLGAVFSDVAVEFTNGVGIGTGNYDTQNPVQTGNDHTFRGVRVSYNGQMGMGGECDRCVLEDSEVSYNNWKEFDFRWEAGGMKMTNTDGMRIRRVRSWSNYGPGIWFDIDNTNNVIEGCWARDNGDVGIMVELFTSGTLIQHNVVTGTRRIPKLGVTDLGTTDSRGGSGILIQVAQNSSVYHNTVVNNQGTGIFINAFDNRIPAGWTGSSAKIWNNVVVENATLTQSFPLGDPGAHEVNVEETTLPTVRSNLFGGNVYERHDGDLGSQDAFFAFQSADNVATSTDDPDVWRNLMAIPPNRRETYLLFAPLTYGALGDPANWTGWTGTLDLQTSQVVALPSTGRPGHCYVVPGANPEAVLWSSFLNNPPPANCGVQNTAIRLITADEMLDSGDNALLAGKDTYVMPGVTVTINGTVTLNALGGRPAKLIVLGTLAGSETSRINVRDGSEVIFRPLSRNLFLGSIDLQGLGSCLLVDDGAHVRLGPGSFVEARQGAFIAVRRGTLEIADDARVVVFSDAGESMIAPGATFSMGRNASVTFYNRVSLVGTAEAPVVFERAGATAWNGLLVAGDNSRLDHVHLSGGTDNVQVTGSGTLVEHVVSTGAAGAALVVRTPSDVRGDETKGVVVRQSRLTGSGIGVQLHLTHDVVLTDNVAEGNDYGVSLFNAVVTGFQKNVVSASAKYGLYLSGTSDLAVGTTYVAGASAGCSAGLNRVTGSGSAEVMNDSGSWFTLGRNGFAGVDGGYNTVADASGILVWSDDKRDSYAEFTWWGGPLDASRVVGPVSTLYALTADPGTGSGTAGSCGTPSEILADSQTRLAVEPVGPDHEGAVRGLLVPALDDDPIVRAAARALLAAWARPATDSTVSNSPDLAAAATAAGLVQARVSLSDDDPTAAQAVLDAVPEPDRDAVEVEQWRMVAAVAEADGRFADALAALDAADAIDLPEPPMDAGNRGGTGAPAVDPLRRAITAAAEAAEARLNDAPAPDGPATEVAPPSALRVLAPWPNPSRGSVTVAVEVPAAGALRVEVYDALGRSVAVLHDGWATPGRLDARLDGRHLAAGVYVVRAVSADGSAQAARFSVVR